MDLKLFLAIRITGPVSPVVSSQNTISDDLCKICVSGATVFSLESRNNLGNGRCWWFCTAQEACGFKLHHHSLLFFSQWQSAIFHIVQLIGRKTPFLWKKKTFKHPLLLANSDKRNYWWHICHYTRRYFVHRIYFGQIVTLNVLKNN